MPTVPISATRVRLLREVPFSNDYKHTRWFSNRQEQIDYFTRRPHTAYIDQQNFQRIDGQYIVRVNKSIDELWGTNYMFFRNTEYDDKVFYAFITKLEYKQRNNTYVHFEIDVLQTWLFEMNFKPSYVLREHRQLWNSNGTPVVNTIDEGLDYGDEYETVSMQQWLPYDSYYFLVVVCQGAVHSPNQTGENSYDGQPLATNNGIQQPLTYYVHPFSIDGEQPVVSVDGSGYFGISRPLEFIQRLSEMTTTVNNVASIYVTDYIGLNVEIGVHGDSLKFDGSMEWAVIDDGTYTLETLCVKDVKEYKPLTKNFGDKYSGFHNVDESKLLMYPYALTILDDFKGNRTVIKNEFVDSRNLNVTVRGSMGTSNKTTYAINDYLSKDLSNADRLLSSIEYALINTNPSDIAVLNDMLSAYLQGNRNSLENQKNSIVFNGVMDTFNGTVGAVASASQGNISGTASSLGSSIRGGGNALLKIQGIQAKLSDINNIPPQINKMGSNTAFDYGNGYRGVYVIKKQIREEYRKILGDFFKMYGYKTNEVKVPNFRTRRRWNFVQTIDCNIVGSFNNNDLQILKDIFDNGITLWHIDDVGNYNLSNEVR